MPMPLLIRSVMSVMSVILMQAYCFRFYFLFLTVFFLASMVSSSMHLDLWSTCAMTDMKFVARPSSLFCHNSVISGRCQPSGSNWSARMTVCPLCKVRNRDSLPN